MKSKKICVIIVAILMLGLTLATLAGYTQTVIHFEGAKNELAFSCISGFISIVLFGLGLSKEEEVFGNNVKKY